jgi:hypothetical protein
LPFSGAVKLVTLAVAPATACVLFALGMATVAIASGRRQ